MAKPRWQFSGSIESLSEQAAFHDRQHARFSMMSGGSGFNNATRARQIREQISEMQKRGKKSVKAGGVMGGGGGGGGKKKATKRSAKRGTGQAKRSQRSSGASTITRRHTTWEWNNG